ncbi:hypothetical protein ACQEVI_26510 [Promicromonospora sp. CA-289599]|uniref:hypothetical protein n=1 Tax=Promicromonospora sp. CA-289599 TaxID=3240014 RepID=UPI003D8A4AED
MEDEELTRARRALRGVDPELDLARVYAESRARALGVGNHLEGDAHLDEQEHAQDHWATDERVVVLLHDLDAEPRRGRSRAYRGRALVWGVAAAAAAAVVVTVVNLPAPGAQPGSSPGTSLSPTTSPEPRPSPTRALTPSEVVDRTAPAVAGADCAVKVRSTLGRESATRFDRPATDTGTPEPVPLSTRPLEVLQLATVDAALDLPGLAGRDHRLDDEFLLEEEDGRALVRIRFDTPAEQVLGGELTRIDVVVDTATWLPYTAETWAKSDDGQGYQVHSEFSWTSCATPSSGPSPAATDGDPSPSDPGSRSR